VTDSTNLILPSILRKWEARGRRCPVCWNQNAVSTGLNEALISSREGRERGDMR
jgi:hypothetical protein